MRFGNLPAYTLATLTWVLGTTTAATPQATPSDEIISGELGRELDEILAGYAAFGFNGAVLFADKNEIIVQKGYGKADRKNDIPYTADTLFDTASFTKQFTAAAILRLEMDGHLSTDDPIAEHLPGVGEEFADVTIYHLLTHTAGFARMGPSGFGPDLETAVTQYLNTNRPHTAGEQYEYYNGGYALLAGIVETAGGMDYRDYCRAFLFEPAGMTSTAFCQDPDLDLARVAHGYEDGQDIGPASTHSYGWEYRGMGGVLTTMSDLYRWHVALQGDDILNAGAKQKYWTPNMAQYACGWFILTTMEGFPWAPPGVNYHRHGGSVAGSELEVMRFPDRDAIIAVVTNTGKSRQSSQLMYNIACRLLTDRYYLPTPPETVTWAPERLDALAGTYVLAESDGRLRIKRDGHGLEIVPLDRSALSVLTRVSQWSTMQTGLANLAVQLVQSIDSGDTTLMADIMMDRIPKNWPSRMIDDYWPSQREQWGEVQSITPIQTRTIGLKRVEVILIADTPNGPWPIQVIFQGGKLNILNLEYGQLPGARRYLPSADGLFVTFDPTVPVQSMIPTLEFATVEETGTQSVRISTADREWTARMQD
ncbi:MAG: beta-lactamase family protein [Planctomycetes bacterium]|nr:beta-lactamase family protein [Planctomycetota bacterium]